MFSIFDLQNEKKAKTMKLKKIVTVGYEAADSDDSLGTLDAIGMIRLLDIRELPISNPGTAYESGHRRVPISSLPLLARTLGVTVEESIGGQTARSTAKRGPAPKLQQQLERITRLPKAQQRFVMQMIDTVLQQQQASR